MASAEHEPITGVWGQSPQRGPEAETLKAFWSLDVQRSQQIYQNSAMLKQKVDKMCDAYRSRHLTLLGRACIANVVICAQLW